MRAAHALVFCVAGLAGSLPACRPATLASADREVYRALDVRRARVPEVSGSLDLAESERRGVAARAGWRASDAPARRITLREALELAARASRELRERREDVYLGALDLSTARHAFRAQPFAGGGGAVEALDDGVSVSGSLDASLSQAFQRGGSLALAIASDFLQDLTGDPLDAAQSILSLDLVLPLLRGSGLAARETLAQAERDTVYALRAYAFFQQEFTVDVATTWFRVLQARDTWTNEERTYASLAAFETRQQALGAQGAGRIPDFEAAQARQDALRADDRRQRARARYESELDALKLLLGLPAGAALEPADDDLAALSLAGPVPAPFAQAAALERASRARLDLRNARDQVQDACRKAEVARDGVGAQLDLSLGAELTGPERRAFDLEDAARRMTLGLDLDLPLDRTAERNAWRAALIQVVRARRALEALEDRVASEVRQALRDLAAAERSYAIQLEGVRLAERRVKGTPLLLEAGQAVTRDVLDAEDDLVQSRNALTQALVDHAVARLRLELAVGSLRVEPEGTYRTTPPPPPPPPPPAAPAAPPPAGTAPAPGK